MLDWVRKWFGMICVQFIAAAAVGGAFLVDPSAPCAPAVAAWNTLTIGPPVRRLMCKATYPRVCNATEDTVHINTPGNFTDAFADCLGNASATVMDTFDALRVPTLVCADKCSRYDLPCEPSSVIPWISVCTPVIPADINPPCVDGAHITCSEVMYAAISIGIGAVGGLVMSII